MSLLKMNLDKDVRGGVTHLQVAGRIKIGGLGPERKKQNSDEKYRLPVKYTHFVITTMAREPGKQGNFLRDEALHEIFGKEPLELPVALGFDDIEKNLTASLVAYNGKQRICRGDLQRAERWDAKGKKYMPRECPCVLYTPGYDGPTPCKLQMKLSVMLRGAPRFGAFHQFRTSSRPMYESFLEFMLTMKSATGGRLAGVPFWLRWSEIDTEDAGGQVRRVPRVILEFRGDADNAFAEAKELSMEEQRRFYLINQQYDEQQLLMAPEHVSDDSGEEGVAGEYYAGEEPPEADAAPASPAPRGELTPAQWQELGSNILGAAAGNAACADMAGIPLQVNPSYETIKEAWRSPEFQECRKHMTAAQKASQAKYAKALYASVAPPPDEDGPPDSSNDPPPPEDDDRPRI